MAQVVWIGRRRQMRRVEIGRGSLGAAYLFPALSFAGASLAKPCSVSTLPLIKPDVRISRIRLSDWLLSSAHDGSVSYRV